MRVYVINLARRPDRRAHMSQRAAEIGLKLEFVDAVDARDFGAERSEVRVGGTPFGRIADGDLACTLSHRKVWRLIEQRGEPYAVVLEDDVRLADDAVQFFSDTSWIPPDAKIVKVERYGGRRRRISVDRERLQARDRSVFRFHTRNVGSAGYVISRAGAREMLEATRSVSVPVDQILFNPVATGIFLRMKPFVLEPALCEQDSRSFPSDNRGYRSPSLGKRLHAGMMELATLGRHLLLRSRLLVGHVRGRIIRSPLTFKA